MSKNQAISLRSQWLGDKLRTARARAKYSLSDAAEYLQMDHTTLGRFERGTHRIRRSYVKDLLDFYGISNRRERAFLLKLAEDAWRKDIWVGDADGLESGFLDYTWLESRAAHIYAFEPLLIHGLLQTSEYTTSLASAAGDSILAGQTDRSIEVRRVRQRILTGPAPTSLSVVFEEPAVRRPVGGGDVLARQLRHLLDTTEVSHVDIQVLPMSTPWDPGIAGGFAYFELHDPYPPVAYIENLAGRTFLEEDAQVRRFERTYDEIRGTALTPKQSRTFIEKIIKDMT